MGARICLIFCFAFSISSFADDNSGLVRFDDLPKLVKERNGNVAAARQVHNASKERTGYLKRSFLPTLSARVGTESAKIGASERENLGFWGAEGRVNLYRGGRDKIEDEIYEGKLRIAANRGIKDFLIEIKAARDNYWNLAAIEAMLINIREALQKNEDNIRSSRKRSGAGVTTGADAVQFELERTILTQELKKLEHEQDVLKSRLSVLIGFEDHSSLKINPEFPHPPEAEFQEKEMDLKSNPDLNALHESENLESLRAKQASRWYLPRLDVYARYGLPSLGDDYTLATRKETELVAGVSLSLDLGQVFQDRVMERAQGFEAKAVSSKIAQSASSLKATSHEIQHDLNLVHGLIHDADQDVQKAQDFLRLTQSEYGRGVKNGPDLLEAFSKYYAFKRRKIELHLEYQLAKSEFESLTSNASFDP